jgi:hypothetical protein
MTFPQSHFRKFNSSKEQLTQYLKNARHDLKIAQADPHHEVRFTYSYQALIKIAIGLVASQGYKVRSIPGHHIKLLERLSELLEDPDVLAGGDAMRRKRNDDFYGEGVLITEKEAADYLRLVQRILKKAEHLIRNKT